MLLSFAYCLASFQADFLGKHVLESLVVISPLSLGQQCINLNRCIEEKQKSAWRSGNGVGRINEVTLRRARLVLGWVTCPDSTPGGGTISRYGTSHPGRLSLSSFRGR